MKTTLLVKQSDTVLLLTPEVLKPAPNVFIAMCMYLLSQKCAYISACTYSAFASVSVYNSVPVSVCMHDTSLLSLLCGAAVFCSCPCVWLFLLCEPVRLSVSASVFFLLHGSVHASVLSVPPAGVWLASHSFLSWTTLPVCAAFTLQLWALFWVHYLCSLPRNGTLRYIGKWTHTHKKNLNQYLQEIPVVWNAEIFFWMHL